MHRFVVWLILLLVSCGSIPEPPAPHTTIRIVSHTYTIQPDIRSRYSITGELVNESATPRYSAQVQARYYDGLDHPLAEMSNMAALQLMQPGQRNPFFIILSADTPLLQSVEHYDLFVSSSTTPPKSTEVVPLKVASHRLQVSSTQTREVLSIAGEVTNTSGVLLNKVVIVGTIYDQQGRISRYSHSAVLGPEDAPQESLGIGETARFAISTGLKPEESDARLPDGYSYTVQAEGYRMTISPVRP
jgi:hypothetical protein